MLSGEKEADSEEEDFEDCSDEEQSPCEDESVFDGLAPTPKRRKLANDEALILSLSSGKYPEFLGVEGPDEYRDPDENDFLDYLRLFWPDSLVDVIVEETNRYAVRKGRSKWVPVCREDIWAFLGIITFMGIARLPRLCNY